MQWGLDHAEKVGLPAYLEASIFGYPLYTRLGFRDIDKVVIKAKEWLGDYDKVYVVIDRKRDEKESSLFSFLPALQRLKKKERF